MNLSIAPAPEPADQTVETNGATLYVEPAAAEALDEMVLDARIEQEQVQFMLKDAVGVTDQSDNGAGPAG